jgi:hypothetical protein
MMRRDRRGVDGGRVWLSLNAPMASSSDDWFGGGRNKLFGGRCTREKCEENERECAALCAAEGRVPDAECKWRGRTLGCVGTCVCGELSGDPRERLPR